MPLARAPLGLLQALRAATPALGHPAALEHPPPLALRLALLPHLLLPLVHQQPQHRHQRLAPQQQQPLPLAPQHQRLVLQSQRLLLHLALPPRHRPLGPAEQQHLLSAAAQQHLLLPAQLEPSAGLHRLVLALVLLLGHLPRAQGLLLLPVLLPVPPQLGAACLAAHPLASRSHQPALLLLSQVLPQPRVAPCQPMLSSEQQSRLQVRFVATALAALPLTQMLPILRTTEYLSTVKHALDSRHTCS